MSVLRGTYAIGSMSQGCGIGSDIIDAVAEQTNTYICSINMVYVGTNLNHASIA